jgi:hypothetical protein
MGLYVTIFLDYVYLPPIWITTKILYSCEGIFLVVSRVEFVSFYHVWSKQLQIVLDTASGFMPNGPICNYFFGLCVPSAYLDHN